MIDYIIKVEPDNKRVLFVLQNAWRKGAKPGETDIGREKAWMRLLWRSQSGNRLREMIPADIDEQQSFIVCNASPFVGNQSFVAFVADSMLMNARMQRLRPDLVVLCGKVAQTLAHVVKQWETPYIIAPHPAWRLLSKVRTAEIRTEIELALS